jgi:hypothetical protein
MNQIEGGSARALFDKTDQAVKDWKTAHEDMTEAMEDREDLEDSDEEIVQDDNMDEDRIEGVEHDTIISDRETITFKGGRRSMRQRSCAEICTVWLA